MQLLYFITTVTSQVHSARHHQRAGYSALPSVYFFLLFVCWFFVVVVVLFGGGVGGGEGGYQSAKEFYCSPFSMTVATNYYGNSIKLYHS